MDRGKKRPSIFLTVLLALVLVPMGVPAISASAFAGGSDEAVSGGPVSEQVEESGFESESLRGGEAPQEIAEEAPGNAEPSFESKAPAARSESEDAVSLREVSEGIDTAEKLQAALASASDGDVLLIAAGFSLPSTIDITKDVTLRAAEGASATLTSQGERHFSIGPGKAVVFEGLVLDGQQAKGGIQVSGATLSLNNVRIANTAKGAVSSTDATVNISGSTFEDNKSDQGGALYAKNSSVTIRESVFTRNSADSSYYGGAIFVSGGKVDVEASSFFENTASWGGGAVYCEGTGSSLTMSGNVFSGNTAQTLGGAVYHKGGALAFVSNSFKENRAEWGGAVYLDENTSLVDSGSEYLSNSSTYSGGAIDLRQGASLELSNSDFTGNVSDVGGALCGYPNTTVNITGGVYSNNRADLLDVNGDGGAVYIHGNSSLHVNGASFVENTAYYNGGAIGVLDDCTVVIGNSTFSGNASQKLKGGAVYVQIRTALTLTNNVFSENNAVQGGAVYAYSSNTVTDEGGNAYTANSASNAGGAVFLYHDESRVSEASKYDLTGAVFTDNTAPSGGAVYLGNDIAADFNETNFVSNKGQEGGAVYGAEGCTVTITGGDYLANEASSDGGAIFMEAGSYMLSIADADFERNKTTSDRAFGGAIYASSNPAIGDFGKEQLIIKNSSFSENSVGNRSFGGAILADVDTDLLGVVFAGNSAGGSGGALYLRGADLTATDITVKGNSSAGGVGGIRNDTGSMDIKDSLFAENANGALYVNNVRKQINPPVTHTASIANTVFSNNTAFDGAAVYLMETAFDISDSTFEGNRAERWGGAIVVYGDDDTATSGTISNTDFVRNAADEENKQAKGGAIYVNTAPVTITGVSSLTDSSSYNGGAVYVDESASLALEGAVTLSENTAALDGGAVFTEVLANVTAGESVVFSDNKAASAHTVVDESDKRLHAEKILTKSYTSYTDSNGVFIGFAYAYSNFDINYQGAYPFIVVKKDKADATLLEGVTFALEKEDGTLIAEKTTDAEGRIAFGVSEIGTYRITETATIDGYVENPDPITVVIDGTDGGAGSRLSVIVENERVKNLSVTYDGNGHTHGEAPIDAQKYALNEAVTVLGRGALVKDGHEFTGWNTKSDGTGAFYSEASTFAIDADTTLYAQWRPVSVPDPDTDEPKPLGPPAENDHGALSRTGDTDFLPIAFWLTVFSAAVLLVARGMRKAC